MTGCRLRRPEPCDRGMTDGSRVANDAPSRTVGPTRSQRHARVELALLSKASGRSPEVQNDDVSGTEADLHKGLHGAAEWRSSRPARARRDRGVVVTSGLEWLPGRPI